MKTSRLLLKWSWRDLRAHWPKVTAIAIVIAIGTGGYAGLTSTTEWRTVSYDASYAELAMYDLRIDTASGSTVDQGTLQAVVASFPAAASVAASEERLVAPTQVDASTDAQTVLVRGAIVGSDFSQGGPHVNSYHAFSGRLLNEADSGAPAVMLERTFATFYDIAPTGTIEVSGGRSVDFVGQATTPEYFTVAPEGEMFMSEATFAGLFTTLATAQELAALPGQVNNLVLTLVPGADRDAVKTELEAALAEQPFGSTVFTRDDNLSYTALTTDVDQDQAMFNALAFLLIGGAVGAAFNLIHRLAEQQRREIGVGMALGVSPRLLAIRPLLVSAQIAVLGVLFGVMFGVFIGNAMATVFTSLIPLPTWETAFPVAVFMRVAAIGFFIPFLASAIPVWRAVRVAPIEAIKPMHLTAVGLRGGKARRVRNTFSVLPFRNLRRARRRTALTVLGIAASLTVLMGFLGIMDSVFEAVDTAERESVGSAPDRVAVSLDTFYPVTAPQVVAVQAAESVDVVEPTLRVGGSVASAATEFEVFIELADMRNGMWSPTVSSGELTEQAGVLLADKAATDLNLSVGDTVTLRHPLRDGLSYRFVESRLPVLGTHPSPLRSIVYMDLGQAGMLNMTGITNALNVLPETGSATAQVQQELFPLGAVTSVQSVTAVTDAVRDAFDQILGVLRVMIVAILFLALLIAFNTAAINLEARAREHATMFAFGVKVRKALRLASTESLVLGIAATLVGLAGGFAMVWWMTQRLLTETLPDFGLLVVVNPQTVAIVAAMGILVVAAAPLLTVRRMRRMDVPGTLRLVE